MNTIDISIPQQTLKLLNDGEIIQSYSISSGANGVGQKINSEQTPLGQHKVYQMIGKNAPVNTVFVGRVATGEIYTPELHQQQPDRDWILTRILWLEGCEEGVNQGGDVDTKSRYIYIHGTPDSTTLGKPGSRGCIRMANSDIIELFELVSPQTPIVIHDR